MLRNSPLQKRFITVILFMLLFTQFQTVFACEFKDGNLQLFCCCDEPGAMSTSCQKNNNCNDASGLPSNDTCCEVSFLSGPSAKLIGAEKIHQQVLLLDAPQPPPPVVSYTLQTAPKFRQPTLFKPYISQRFVGKQVYRRSQRFRI